MLFLFVILLLLDEVLVELGLDDVWVRVVVVVEMEVFFLWFCLEVVVVFVDMLFLLFLFLFVVFVVFEVFLDGWEWDVVVCFFVGVVEIIEVVLVKVFRDGVEGLFVCLFLVLIVFIGVG